MITGQSFDAGQRFLLAAKTWWTSTLYRQLRGQYETRAGARAAKHSVADVAEIVEDLTLYRYFAWLERHLQRMKYSGAHGLARYYDQERKVALSALADADGELLQLDPKLELPQYYTGVDIHQHPGGVWSDDIAGLVYEHGARTTTPLLGQAHADLHTRFTDRVAQDGTFDSVLDMGCGFGKSTQPFYTKFPEAQIHGVDFSAPCLRLAASVARKVGARNVRFRQADAAATPFSGTSFDLVTSTMLLHETPPKPLQALFSEAMRVLEPGGRMVHLDFYYFPDAFARFMHYGHGRRNNEPYMQPLSELDLPKVLRRHGFTDVVIEPFREAEQLGPERTDVWRLPWTVISARKPKTLRARRGGRGSAQRARGKVRSRRA